MRLFQNILVRRIKFDLDSTFALGLSVIFEEVARKLSASILNNNKRYRDGFKFLRKGIFARHALFCIRIGRRKLKVKTKLTESN